MTAIPLLWRWDGDEADAWQSATDTKDNHDFDDGTPHHGPTPSQLHWLGYRRARWFHEAQVRG